MILGTVQLGMDYGINNVDGKPTHKEAYKILDYAYNHKIKKIDTASAYGESEKIIGEYIKSSGNKFNICTKLPVDVSSFLLKFECEKTLSVLNIDYIDVYYLHKFEQCKDKAIMSELIGLKNIHKINKIGVSIYEPIELEYIINNLQRVVDVVQIPFNIFDNSRWLDNLLLKKACEAGIELYIRSVYLQGLLFKEKSDADIIARKMTNILALIQNESKRYDLSLAEFALSFVCSFPYFSEVILGVEKKEQLKMNICAESRIKKLDEKTMESLYDESSKLPICAIDPRKW